MSLDSSADCPAYNTSQLNVNVYDHDHLADIAAANSLTFSAALLFPFESPRQCFHLQWLNCYAFNDYTIGGAVSVGDLLINQVTACDFSRHAGSAARTGLITLSITIQDTPLNGVGVTSV